MTPAPIRFPDAHRFKVSCIRPRRNEIQSINENAFECFANTVRTLLGNVSEFSIRAIYHPAFGDRERLRRAFRVKWTTQCSESNGQHVVGVMRWPFHLRNTP